MPSHTEWTERQDSATVDVDGHDLDVAFYDEGSGDPVVLLHGIPTWSYLWRDVVPGLEDERRVIVPDMVGYGNSSMEDGFDRSIRAQEEMVDGLLDELGVETVSFVGHDLGGGVGLRYASHRPDAVDELVLSNAVAYDSWPIGTVANLGLPSTVEENGVDGLQEMLDGLYRKTLFDDDPSEEFVEGMKAQWRSERAAVSLCRNAVATNTNHTTELDYGAIAAETLLLWGTDDEFQPVSYAERLRDDLSGAEVRGLDDAEHWVMQDRPDAYREELRSFLVE
ncbi:alpha/beta hydrolase fold protein [Halogeometricum pallidum JCM 14848]|uniref:Alpha/beta hydrolase fold protein n=1 Tax=Halogeometricum pallidum JCM 14848 TaxID=1227487 RepID=M0CVU0_HALPD|nr:alpha/beta hydrolase [Halogeometricum pallidum]ELZ26763.1 alpha/beta hydrolase fold protein [Halogeometricum pallidum JCM 14848]